MNQIPNIEETHNTRAIEEINNYLDDTVHKTCQYYVYSDLKDLVANIEVAHHRQLQKARESERELIMAEINKKYWLNPKRTKNELAKDNAWNDLGNTLRKGV